MTQKLQYKPNRCTTRVQDDLVTFFYPTQDLDRIAEANELYDAVLTGSVDRDKKVTTNVPQNKTPTKDEAKPTTLKSQQGRHSLRRLALYVGNFPWVSNSLSVLMLITFLLYCPIPVMLFCPRGLAEH